MTRCTGNVMAFAMVGPIWYLHHHGTFHETKPSMGYVMVYMFMVAFVGHPTDGPPMDCYCSMDTPTKWCTC